MQLNLPSWEALEDRQNILIAGAGGGFDVFSGLPIYFTLKDTGKTAHLANLSFSDFDLTGIVSKTETIIEDVLVIAWRWKIWPRWLKTARSWEVAP